MAFNAFINFGDIKGEVTEDKHKDWVAVTKVTFNVSQPASFTRQSAGGGTAEAAEFSALTIEKAIDKAPVRERTLERSPSNIKEPVVILSFTCR